jgi:hypothetical protein
MKNRSKNRHGVTNYNMKTPLNSFVTHCVIYSIQSFMDYTAIYRQQETGHGAHQNFYEIGIDSYL